MVTVTDDEIRDAVRWLHREAGLVVEPSGAAATAAVLASGRRPTAWSAIVSGGTSKPRTSRSTRLSAAVLN
jgi:threonine dehydratase